MLRSTTVGHVKIYNLSEGKQAPGFLSERAKRALSKNPDHARRVDLLQGILVSLLIACQDILTMY